MAKNISGFHVSSIFLSRGCHRVQDHSGKLFPVPESQGISFLFEDKLPFKTFLCFRENLPDKVTVTGDAHIAFEMFLLSGSPSSPCSSA